MASERPYAQSASSDPLVEQVIGGRYRITGVLGTGGMGIVYEGTHLDVGRNVAVKVLGPAWAADEKAVRRFHQEARACGNIGHPNIVHVYDLGRLTDARPAR